MDLHGFTISFLQNDVQQGGKSVHLILPMAYGHIFPLISGENMLTHCCQKLVNCNPYCFKHTQRRRKCGLITFIHIHPIHPMMNRAAGHMRTQGLDLPHIFAAGPRIGHLEPWSKCLTSWQQIRKCLRHCLRFA